MSTQQEKESVVYQLGSAIIGLIIGVYSGYTFGKADRQKPTYDKFTLTPTDVVATYDGERSGTLTVFMQDNAAKQYVVEPACNPEGCDYDATKTSEGLLNAAVQKKELVRVHGTASTHSSIDLARLVSHDEVVDF